ncbi:MAG: hypothetical protein ACRBEQ_12430 [Hyphomonas sp.]
MRLSNLRLVAISTTAIAMVAACTQQSVESADRGQDDVAAPMMEQAELVRGSAATTAADGSETLGFAFSYFWFSVHETPQDCPDGYAMALRDVAIMHLPKAQQTHLLKAENRSTYYKMGYALSAKRMKEQNGASICNIPDSYDDPEHRVVQSNVSYGRDLDGVNSAGDDDTSCGTNDFVSPDGISGVDNELYRVMGCIDSFRRDAEFAGGAMEDYHVGSYRDGETTTLMQISGVDDRMNDDDVTVGVYSSSDATPFDSQKKGIGFASLSVTENTLWHNEVKGKIVNGELITEPFDLRLKFGWSGRPAEYNIKDSRIHLTLKEDGTAEGDLAGFFKTIDAYRHNFHNERGALEVANGFTCPAVWDSLQKYSDGHKDPETGKCTTISTAMTIQAVPAFLIQPPAEKLTKYVLDTTDYYGVNLEEIAVEGAEVRPLKGAGRPDDYKSERELAEEAKAKAQKESAEQ